MKKILLVTGGTGFLGRELALSLKNNYNVILGARNNKQNFKAKGYTGCEVVPLDVTNAGSVKDVMVEFKPSIVVHAAATKFVDLSEKFPMECIDVNVTGSQNVARIAIDCGVETVVGVSTDKASPPVRNTYGLTKALMERLFCSMNSKTSTQFTCVRYGNVAWSTGSVLPLWKRMHDDTKVIGTTGPEMRRFFFTVHEAVELVKTAIENISIVKGKVLSREMKSAQIMDVLEVWIKKYGGRYEKIDGRPGERLDEFLIGDQEIPFTQELNFSGVRHFLLSFNEKVASPVTVALSSENANRLTEKEIEQLISNPPSQEFL
ncbi:MAG: polysaccharide biosynthesis protein [Cyclobacteriaceae bacterium]|nr:polysaccharide biosynthesis protein [Cyclobacteriaceae bacterium]